MIVSLSFRCVVFEIQLLKFSLESLFLILDHFTTLILDKILDISSALSELVSRGYLE